MSGGIVSLRLGSRFNETGTAAEKMGGLGQIFFLRQLSERIDSDWEGVLDDLNTIRDTLFNRRGAFANVTIGARGWDSFRPHLNNLLDALPNSELSHTTWTAGVSAPNEGITLPAQVNYVGTAANLYDLGYKCHGSAAVISRYLKTSWLWERVRVQGGAYGGFCNFSRQSGLFRFISYRDPNLKKTLDNFAGTAGFLRELEMNDDELSRAIIGTIGDMDAYQLPDAKGYTSMLRHILGISQEERQEIRDQIMATNQQHFHDFAHILERSNEASQIVVMGSNEAIESFNTEHDGGLEIVKIL